MAMESQKEILDKLYLAFIGYDTPKNFFNGLCDYFDYIRSVPEFNKILADLLNEFQSVEKKLNDLDAIAVKRLKEIHKELSDYIVVNKIDRVGINEALKEYDLWLAGKIVGSRGLAEALHDNLSDIIRYLYEIPEHKEFASKYILFWKDGVHIRHYLLPPEIKEYFDLLEEQRERYKKELWGQMNDIARYYEIIKNGREKRKELVKEGIDKNNLKATFELISSHDILYSEWRAIEDEKTNREPIFFNVQKIKPVIIRFQGHLIVKLNANNPDFALKVKAQQKAIEKMKEKFDLTEEIKNSVLAELKNLMEKPKKKAQTKTAQKGGKEPVKKIIIIKLNGSKKLLAINDNYEETKKIKNSEWWDIFIKETEERDMMNRTNVKEIPSDMASYFNYHKKCPIYMGGKYALTEIFTGRGIDTAISPDVKTKVINESRYLSLKNRKNKK